MAVIRKPPTARRRWLARTGALAAASAVTPWWSLARAQSAANLNALPRSALVIGNTDYSDAPLKNPVNDAKAIAAELQKTGFTVNVQINAGRNQMAAAIKEFGSKLAQNKSVGLFYYAGHGAQLAWHNYLIPVDADIERIDDLQSKAVQLNSLLQSLVAAKNPMNVIILDACRDNPFGRKVPTELKGLSQFDAPPGSLLAYATAPGNTAADGEGDNGLYTEHLLRELAVPEAKIEDVFKRVRLAVRRSSRGRQIPWESTSLEDDFYFVPPKQTRRPSDEERDRLFAEELAVWEKVKNLKEPAPLEDYLQRYPSGKFSELAQFRLDRLLAQQPGATTIASSGMSPADIVRKRKEELARAEAELKKAQALAEAEEERRKRDEISRADAERKRREELAKAEAERKRLEELARTEAERRKREETARAEAERKRRDEIARAKAELRKQEELAKAEADRKRQDELARAEAELKKQQELALAEAERRRQEEVSRIEVERKRREDLARAEAERQRLEELARAEAERRKQEQLVRAEAERKQKEELARADAELKRQQEIARSPITSVVGMPMPITTAPNPYSKGSARPDTNYRVGDSYRFRVVDVLTKVERRQYSRLVTKIDENEVTFNDGVQVIDFLGNTIANRSGPRTAPRQYFPMEYLIGKKWTSRYEVRIRGGPRDGTMSAVDMAFKITGREEISVPAGTFNAFKIEGRGFIETIGTQEIFNFWVAPDTVRRPIVQEFIERWGATSYWGTDRHELISYSQSE